MIRLWGILLMMSLLFAVSCTATTPPLPPLTIPDCLGVNIHFSGRDQAQVDKIADGGFRFIRMDFSWGGVERKKGIYNFETYDQLVDSLASRNIRPILIFDYGNGNYDEGKALYSNEGRAAFAAFAKAGAAHFKGKGVVWELWNEPSNGAFTPENYAKLAKAVYPEMKKGDPNSVLVGPALAGWNFAWFDKACKNGLLNYVDGISLHPYGAPKPEDVVEYYDTIRSIIKKYAPKDRTYPLVSSEWGYPAFDKGVTTEQHAQYIVRSFLINIMNECRVNIWYDWRDDDRYATPHEMEFHFGVLYNDFKEKPTYSAMKTLSTELDGYSFTRRLQTKSDDDYLTLFGKKGEYRMAAWTAGKAHAISIPLDVKSVTIVSLISEKKQIDVKNGMLNLDLTGSVQYIEPNTTSRRWAAESAWNVAGKVVIKRGETIVNIKSELKAAKGKLNVSGNGFDSIVSPIKSTKTDISEMYTWDGSSKPQARVSLALDGIKRPLVRVIDLDTSACPHIEALPPTDKELFIAIDRPSSQLNSLFMGKVVLSKTKGIQLANNSAAFELPDGVGRAIVRFKIDKLPKSIFSYTCTLLDQKGNTILKTPVKRYAIVDVFSKGRPGDEVSKYHAEVDSPSKAKFTYTKAPVGSPLNICTKLDFSFEAGYVLARVSPTALAPIPGKPLCLRAWVKGDNGDGSAKLRIKDASGQIFQPNYGFMNFADWRCLDVDLTGLHSNHWGGKNDGHIQYPISWESIFAIEIIGHGAKGETYIGPLMLCYD